jgi:hypothetical protein
MNISRVDWSIKFMEEAPEVMILGSIWLLQTI